MAGRFSDEYFTKDLPDRVAEMGHRQFVGGFSDENWYGIGKLQYHTLVAEGLRPDHVFFDIGCGPLRLGQYLIPYLEEGRYHGLDMVEDLIRLGAAREFFADIIAIKQPRFFINEAFCFDPAPLFDYAFAQSLLTQEDAGRCLRALRGKAHDHSKLYVTFFEATGDRPANPEGPSDPNRNWFYSREEMMVLSAAEGWHFDYIGDWNHPANQMLVRLRPAGAER